MVQINHEKCIGCGLCVRDCVGKALRIEEKKCMYSGKCILCGHCVAICPKNAVAIPSYDMADVVEYEKETFDLNPENVLNTIKFRRSIRDYKDKKVETEILEQIIQAGRYTETAVNYQATRFTVIQDALPQCKDMIYEGFLKMVNSMQEGSTKDLFMSYYTNYKENPENDRLFFNAPAMVVVDGYNLLDGGLASANMEMMAVSLGLGVLFNGYVLNAIKNSPEACEFLNLGDRQMSAVFLLGYPNRFYKRTAPRKGANVIYK